MKANRKADLQRKLALAPVPKPPDGLAERLKREIPQNLRFDTTRNDRARLSTSVAFNVRVAASILLMVSSLYLVLHLLSREGEDQRSAILATQSVKHPPASVMTPVEPTSTLVAHADAPQDVHAYSVGRTRTGATSTKQIDKFQEKKEKNDGRAFSAPAETEAKKDANAHANEVATFAAVDTVATRAVAPAAAPAPPPPVAAAAPEDFVRAPAGARDERRMKDAITVQAQGLPVPVPPRSGELAIQRFSVPGALPSGSIVLNTEATRGRFEETDIFLRASVDSGIDAHDVRVDIAFNPDAVARIRWLAGGWRWGASSFRDQTHTTLVQVAIGQNADDTLRIATIRLTYRSGTDPNEKTIETIVRRGDVRSWQAASQRMKSSSLAGEWAAGRNRSLVAEAARNAGLTELATFVTTEAP